MTTRWSNTRWWPVSYPNREQAVAYLDDRLSVFLYHYLELLGIKRRGNKEASSYIEDELRAELHFVCATALNARVTLHEIPARLGEVVQLQLARMRRGEIDARFLAPADITDLETIAEQLQTQTFFQGKLALPRRALWPLGWTAATAVVRRAGQLIPWGECRAAAVGRRRPCCAGRPETLDALSQGVSE